MVMPIVDLSGQGEPRTSLEADRYLRGIATVLGKFLPELPKAIETAAESHAGQLADIGDDIGSSIDQVCTEISDLTAAVRELTDLIKEIPMFPREPWGRTRRVLSWCFRR